MGHPQAAHHEPGHHGHAHHERHDHRGRAHGRAAAGVGHAPQGERQARGHEDHAGHVQPPAARGLEARQEPEPEPGSEQPKGNVDEEHPVPGRHLHQPATEDRSHDRRDEHRNAHEAHHPAQVGRPSGTCHEGGTHGHDAAAAQPLEHTQRHEHAEGGGHGAQHRGDGEQGDGAHVHAAGSDTAEPVVGERDDRRGGQGIAGHRPGHRGVRGQRAVRRRVVALEGGDRHVDDGAVEHGHEGSDHDDGGHPHRAGAGRKAGRCRSGARLSRRLGVGGGH